jgi:hypothetical protein
MFTNAVRVGLVALLIGGCGKVQETIDGGVEPDAAPFSDGGSGADGAVDEIPPDTSIESAPVSPSGSATADFGFAATEDGCTFRCKLDDGAVADCEADYQVEVDADGAHDLWVHAVDPSGNEDPTPAHHAWVVDTKDPVVTVSSGPASPTSATDATLEFTADEQATFDCRLDGGAWSSCADSKSYPVVGEGDHLFEVRATDAAGNEGTGSWSWTVDGDAPSIEILTHPVNPTKLTSAAFTFAAEAGASVLCRLDSGSFGACTSPTTMNYPSLTANASHTFRVKATDTANNSATAVFTWTIDTQGPTVDILTKPADPTAATSAGFTFSVNEAATVECRLDSGSFGSCTSPTSMNYPSVGANTTHTFRVKATDAATNETIAQYSWTVDTTPPDTLWDATPSDPYPVDWADFAFHAAAADTSYYECNLDGAGWGGCSSPIHWTKLGYGGHSLQVRATDALGNVEMSPASYAWKAEPGLILHYPFDASLKNASKLGPRFDGDGGGYDFVAGRRNEAILFAEGEVKIPQTYELLSNDLDYTIAMWVAEAAPQVDLEYRFLFNFRSEVGGLMSFRWNSKDYELRTGYAAHDGSTNANNTGFYLGEGWKHIIYEHNGSPGKGGDTIIYVNGTQASVLINQTSGVVFNKNQLESLLIGSNSRFIIDELRFYNRLYTNQEKCEQIIGGTWVTPVGAPPYCKF